MRASSAITSRSLHSAMSVPPATQKPCTLQTVGLSEWNSDMKPRRLRLIICQSTTGSQVCEGSWLAAWTAGSSGEPASAAIAQALHALLGRLDQVVAAAEALAVARQRDHVDGGVEVRALDALGQLPRHGKRDPVAALRAGRG